MMQRGEKLDFTSLRTQVYEHLRRAINEGDLEAGTYIDQKKLAADLGISRQPLRDALIQLELEGFVTVYPRKGVRVNHLTLDDIRHLYEIIGALEGAALRHAYLALDERDVTEMRDRNALMVEALEAGDFNRYLDLDLGFHDVFLNRSDNAGLVRTVRICKQRLCDFPRNRRFDASWELQSTMEHGEIVDLLHEHRTAEAADYLREVHWSYDIQRPYIRAYHYMDDPRHRAIGNVELPPGKFRRPGARRKRWTGRRR